jgi:DNA-binding PadR family transcriptional regulator
MKIKPSYYAILPAEVRYDNNLTEFEKILFSEITALADKNGYCFASNTYFADLYGKTHNHISYCISKLNDSGYITVSVEQDKGNTRKIYLGLRKIVRGITINRNTSNDKSLDPITKNMDSNITIQDYQSNLTKESKKERASFDDIVKAFTEHEPLRHEIFEFIKMRKLLKKPLTNHSLQLSLTQKNKGLFDLSGGSHDKALDIVRQTLRNSWLGFYPLRADKPPGAESKGEKQNRVLRETLQEMREKGVI